MKLLRNTLLLLLACQINLNSLKFLGEEITASIYFQNEQFKIVSDLLDENALAQIKYTNGLNSNGWDYLLIKGYEKDKIKYEEDQISYAMGYLEGVFTSSLIYNHFQNLNSYYFFDYNRKMPDFVKEFLQKNIEFLMINGSEKKSFSPYWNEVNNIINQYKGLVDGYNSIVEKDKQITYEEFMILNANGDIENILLLPKDKRPNHKTMATRQLLDFVDSKTHCSVLFKVLPDFSDIWFGHNTWMHYSSMMRIMKEYRYITNSKSRSVVLSSYPGSINSIDDFYLTDADLVVTETTNHIYNTDLYDLLTPESILTWARALVANRLAGTSKEWTEIFSLYNSGTYNNQFMILDLKLVDTANRNIMDNAFWIIEQVPGYIESADVTQHLRFGYWASYNSPFFKSIRKLSGIEEILIQKPELKDAIDYDTCARANIFRRDQSKVNNLQDFKKIMRYNDFKNDPLSKNEPSWAIAARKDLYSENPTCKGATDAKIGSVKEFKTNKMFYIISGPTNENHINFDVESTVCNSNGQFKFNGLPKQFNFKWEEYKTKLFE